MGRPWLEIPLADYEAHMALPAVWQAQMLAEELTSAVETYRPRSVAVVGCAGGNGFEALEAARLERVVGIDVNPAYVEAVRVRFGTRIPQLELYCASVEDILAVAAVDLIYAGLIF